MKLPKLDYNFQPPVIKNLPSEVSKKMKKYMKRIEDKLTKEYKKRFDN
tara:strand:+ start:245 stop:388 length:144 start_codon:yes stop_codon:yes gene_type:complete